MIFRRIKAHIEKENWFADWLTINHNKSKKRNFLQVEIVNVFLNS